MFCRRKRVLETAVRPQCVSCKRWCRQCLRWQHLAFENYFDDDKVGSKDFRYLICYSNYVATTYSSPLVKLLRDFSVPWKFISYPIFSLPIFLFLQPHCHCWLCYYIHVGIYISWLRQLTDANNQPTIFFFHKTCTFATSKHGYNTKFINSYIS